MIGSWFKGVLFALLRSSAMAIDCLFGCFRVEDDHNSSATHIVTGPLSSDFREPVVSRNRNRLYSVILSGEKEDSPSKDKEGNALGTLQPDIEVGEPKDEAKFQKGCGSLPRIPAEILKVVTPQGGQSEESSKFHSIRKLNLDNQPEQPPTPVKFGEEWVNMSGSLSCTPCSSLTSKEQSSSSSTQENSSDRSVVTAVQFRTNHSKTSREDFVATTVQKSKNKSVHFECESGWSSFSSKSSSSSESDRQYRKQSEQPSAAAAGDHKPSSSSSSPYPTPLKLTDEMQTPGTVFTSYQALMGKGKNPRIRSQYVYSLINPIQTFSLPKKVLLEEEEEEESKSNQVRRESLEQAGDDDDESTPKSKLGMSEEGSLEEGLNVESRLSSWLRVSPTNQNTNNKHLFRTPNSDTKYKKEDEKVDLQATPFEERLEKAFSGEATFIS